MYEWLAADLAATIARVAGLGRDLAEIIEANALVGVDDEHDPEGSSTAFERAQVASLLAEARAHLAELAQARERLDRGEYGRCEKCGEPIPMERLQVRPVARTCVLCAARRQR